MAMRKLSGPQRALHDINKAYEKTHASLHADYRRKYLETQKAMGLPPIEKLSDHLNHPIEFHEAMEEHQKALVAGLALAAEARRVSVRNQVRSKYRRR